MIFFARPGQVLEWYLEAPALDSRDMALQVYAGDDEQRQWLTYTAECPECGKRWVMVRPESSFGIECPYCGIIDLSFFLHLPETHNH